MSRLWIMAMLFAPLLTGMAVGAQDELVGTWELIIDEETEGFAGSTILTLSPNGDLLLLLAAEFPPDFFGDFESEDEDVPEIPLLTEGLAIRLVARGSWEADDEVFTLSVDEVEFTINGLSIEEFFREAALEMAAALAEELEISEEDSPNFEETTVELAMLQFDPEGFEEIFADVFDEDQKCHYRVEGDILITEDEFGDVSEFRRIAATAVSEMSWGQAKAALR